MAWMTLFRTAMVLALLAAGAARASAPEYIKLEQRLSAEQLRATGLDTLSPEQLALLNHLLSQDTRAVAEAAQPQAAVQVTAAAPAAPAAASVAPAEPAALAAPAAVAAPDPDSTQRIGLNDAPILSRAQGEVSGWEPGTEFRLENGQVWKVLKGKMKLREPLQSPAVRVVPGFAGRWFLEVDPDLPKARVYRID
jgi:hypothetical protein